MNQPSSRNLSHDYPAWRGLSLRELFWIVVTTTPMIALICAFLGSLIGFPIASGSIGFVGGFIIAITLLPKRIALFKEGKPHGQIKKEFIQLLVRLKLKHTPWIHYQGRWHKNKRIGV